MTQNNDSDAYTYLVVSKTVTGQYNISMLTFSEREIGTALEIFAATHLEDEEVLVNSLTVPVKLEPGYYIDDNGYLRCRIGNRADL